MAYWDLWRAKNIAFSVESARLVNLKQPIFGHW